MIPIETSTPFPFASGLPEHCSRSQPAPTPRTTRRHDLERFQLSPFVDPESDLSPASLGAYRSAGAARLVMFSQKSAAEIADSAAPRWIEKTAAVVQRARGL